MAAGPPSPPVPHPAVLAARKAREIAAKAADTHRQDAIRELARELDIDPVDLLPGEYVPPPPPPPKGRKSLPPTVFAK